MTMEGKADPVKPKRRYDSSRRQRQAVRTREAILETARRLFLGRGYAGTTIASIAEAADVSVETIYKAFGGKPGLVRAISEKVLEGVGPIPAEQRSDEMRTHETDPYSVMERWGMFTTEVAPLAAPIALLIRTAAATDPEMAGLLEELDQARLVRMEHNARQLLERGDFREGVTLEHARDVLWAYSSPELYGMLVLRQRWPLEQYGQFVADGMIAALLPPR
ncbi:MAG: helix-turn-helix domain-containing protein [Actinomycetota bacterium]